MTARYFGTPEQYADLFGFIRASQAYLVGYEDAAAIGPGILETRWGLRLPLEIAGNPELYAVVRAKPGQPDAPVVVHLVDWRQEPQAAVLKLRPDAFFPGRKLTVSLLIPTPFAAEAHQQAERTKDYAALATRVPLQAIPGETSTEVRVPPVTPWGMLLVQPAP
jgi:hypothetical protein